LPLTVDELVTWYSLVSVVSCRVEIWTWNIQNRNRRNHLSFHLFGDLHRCGEETRHI